MKSFFDALKNRDFLIVLTVLGIILLIMLAAPQNYQAASPKSLAMAPPEQGLKRVADFYFDVATGNVRGHSSVNKFGGNPDVDSAAIEDVWDGGGTWPEPTTTQVYTVTSTSTADATGGTGALTLQVYGLDSAGALQNETIALSGTVVVTLTNQYQMIHRMVVRTAGSGGVNAGTITANSNTDGNVTAQINIGNNQTLMAVYKIPAGSDGCVLNFYASLLKATGATATVNILLLAKPTGEVWQTKHEIGIIKDGSSLIEHKFYVPNCFEPLTIIKMAADSNVNDVGISAGFDMILKPN